MGMSVCVSSLLPSSPMPLPSPLPLTAFILCRSLNMSWSLTLSPAVMEYMLEYLSDQLLITAYLYIFYELLMI